MRVFISYRRSDSQHIAARLATLLGMSSGIRSVFLDVDDILPGENFPDRLQAALDRADVCLVLIGPQWTGEEAEGPARIHDAGDFVRIEVAEALRRGKRVVPVILDDASIPPAEALPEDLRPLTQRNALFLRHQSFNQDADFLVDAVLGQTANRRGLMRRHPVLHGLARALGGLALGLGLFTLAAVANRAISGTNLETALGGLGPVALVLLLCLAAGLAVSFRLVRLRRPG